MRRTLAAIAAATATFAASIGLVTTGGWLISEAALRPPLLVLEVAIVSVRAFGIARGSFRWVERVVSHDAALHETVERRAQLWSALAGAGPRGAWALRRGDAVNRLMQDAEVLQDHVTRVVVPATAAVLTGAGAVALQAHLQPTAALAFLAALALAGGVVPWLVHRTEFTAAQQTLQHRAALNATLSELVEHRDEMRVLGVVHEVRDAVRAIDARRLAVELRASTLSGLTQFVALLASGCAIAAAMLLGVPAVLDGRLQGPHLAVVVLLPWSASEVVMALALAATAQVRVRAARQRLDAVDALHIDVPSLAPSDRPGLQVSELTVAWDAQPVIRDCTFAVAPGERLAVVGPSGAGKSTLVSALLGLTPYTGSVAVGGARTEVARSAAVTAVPQAPHVFRTSVRENLRLAAGPVDDAQLVAALERVGLGELALDRDLGDGALSGGETVRLGLARALLAEAPVIVLDEPTEHLDDASAAQVMDAIRAATATSAVVMATHRLTDVPDADRVLVLRPDGVPLLGTYDECLRADAWFASAVAWHLDKARVD